MKSLKTLLGIALATAGLGGAIAVGAVSAQPTKEIKSADAVSAPYTVYIVSGNDNWLSWNNRFCLGDGETYSSASTSPIDSDFTRYSNTSNFNVGKIGNTEYKFQKVTISSLKSGNWITVQKYNSTGSSWEADGYNGGDQKFADGANTIINGTNNVLYVKEYSGRPWLEEIWKITGWYYKVNLHYGLDLSSTSASLQKGTYTPSNPAAITGYTFEGWYTNPARTAQYKYTSGTLTADLNLYAKYTEDTYSVTVAGGSPVAMTTSDHVEYTANITANAGDTVTFTKNGANYAFTPENSTNNNYSTNGFRFGGTFAIYLKTNNAQLWAAGMPTSATSVYYLMVGGIGHGQMSNNPSNANEVQMTGVHFNANDAINILNVNNNTTYTWKNPNKNDASVAGFTKSGDNIICNTAGYYDLYYNFDANSLYFGESSSSACVTFSNNFLTEVGTNTCKYNEQTKVVTTDLDDLKAEWVNQYAAWVALGQANQYAQDIMRAKSSSDDDELGRCVRLYDYIVSKYGSQLNGTYQGNPFVADFMGRDPAPLSQTINPISQNNGNSRLIIVVVSLVSVISLSGVFFLLRKKKHN